jgi:hypothetical protein
MGCKNKEQWQNIGTYEYMIKYNNNKMGKDGRKE